MVLLQTVFIVDCEWFGSGLLMGSMWFVTNLVVASWVVYLVCIIRIPSFSNYAH